MRRNTLNNIIMGNKRKDPVYQTVITDLAIAGAIDRKVAETLLGYEIPSYLKLEDGRHFDDPVEKKPSKKEEKDSAKKKDALADGLGQLL